MDFSFTKPYINNSNQMLFILLFGIAKNDDLFFLNFQNAIKFE